MSSVHLLRTLFIKLNFIAKYDNIRCSLQQGLPMIVVPRWIPSLRPGHPTLHTSAFKISRTEECLIVKDWSKIVHDRREVLGGSNQKRNPQLGDMFICMLQYDESGELYMFYAILPEREQQE